MIEEKRIRERLRFTKGKNSKKKSKRILLCGEEIKKKKVMQIAMAGEELMSISKRKTLSKRNGGPL